MSAKQQEIAELEEVTEHTNRHKIQTPEAIQKLLLPVENLILCDDNESDYSELSDKYHDLQKEDCRLKIYENQSILDNFTEDYKKTVMELREELKIPNSISECFKDIKQKANPWNFKSETHNTVDHTIDLNDFEKDTDIENGNDTIIPAEIWNLILVNSKDASFQITPPNYNCFKQEKRHWLETPHVPWKILNTSITKCQKWLEEQDSLAEFSEM